MNDVWGEIPAGTSEFSIQKQGRPKDSGGQNTWPSCPVTDGNGAEVLRMPIDAFARLTDAMIVQTWGPGVYRIAFYVGKQRNPKFSKQRGLAAPKVEEAPPPKAPPPPPVAMPVDPFQMMLFLEDRISRRYDSLLLQSRQDAATQIAMVTAQCNAQVQIAQAQSAAEVERQKAFYTAITKAQKPDDDGGPMSELFDRLDDLEDKIGGAAAGAASSPPPLELSTPDGQWNIPALAQLFVSHAPQVIEAITKVPDLMRALKAATPATALPAATNAAPAASSG